VKWILIPITSRFICYSSSTDGLLHDSALVELAQSSWFLSSPSSSPVLLSESLERRVLHDSVQLTPIMQVPSTHQDHCSLCDNSILDATGSLQSPFTGNAATALPATPLCPSTLIWWTLLWSASVIQHFKLILSLSSRILMLTVSTQQRYSCSHTSFFLQVCGMYVCSFPYPSPNTCFCFKP
jgi:hypothetical protein